MDADRIKETLQNPATWLLGVGAAILGYLGFGGSGFGALFAGAGTVAATVAAVEVTANPTQEEVEHKSDLKDLKSKLKAMPNAELERNAKDVEEGKFAELEEAFCNGLTLNLPLLDEIKLAESDTEACSKLTDYKQALHDEMKGRGLSYKGR